MKILVAQTIFLGDLVLTIPLLQHLRQAYPTAQIDVLVANGMEGLLDSHPAVSSIITYDKTARDKGLIGMWRMARRLRREGYSLALVLPGSIRTALVVYLAGIRQSLHSV